MSNTENNSKKGIDPTVGKFEGKNYLITKQQGMVSFITVIDFRHVI